MSIFVVWDEPQRTILHFVYRPDWTETHFEAAQGRARFMLNQVEHRVDIIIDQQQVRVDPHDFLRHAQRLTTITRHANANRVVLLGMPADVHSLATISDHENPLRDYILAATMDEAYELLWEAVV